MAELTTRGREHIKKDNFAYVDQSGEGHLPIHDESHIRNAMARIHQMTDVPADKMRAAARKL